MSVGTNIKQFRDQARMTQEELADKLGVARSTVTQWENGWSNPRMGMVQKLAGVFHVTSSDIVSDEPVKSPLPDKAIPVRGTSAMVPVRVLGRTHAGERMDEDKLEAMMGHAGRNVGEVHYDRPREEVFAQTVADAWMRYRAS